MNLLIPYGLFFLSVGLMLYKRQIKDFFIRKKKFKCINCGECCRLKVSLSPKDIRRINSKEDYVQHSKNESFIKRINGYCYFLFINKGISSCTIYDKRPEICRNFPVYKAFGVAVNDSRCVAFHKKN